MLMYVHYTIYNVPAGTLVQISIVFRAEHFSIPRVLNTLKRNPLQNLFSEG